MDGWKGGDVRIDLRRKHGTRAFFDFGVDFVFLLDTKRVMFFTFGQRFAATFINVFVVLQLF